MTDLGRLGFARRFMLAALVVLTLGLASCGNGQGGGGIDIDVVGGEDNPQSGDSTGFLDGLWDGLVAPFTLIASIFSDEVTIYESSGDSNAYAFGFGLGLVVMVSLLVGLFGLRRLRAV